MLCKFLLLFLIDNLGLEVFLGLNTESSTYKTCVLPMGYTLNPGWCFVKLYNESSRKGRILLGLQGMALALWFFLILIFCMCNGLTCQTI